MITNEVVASFIPFTLEKYRKPNELRNRLRLTSRICIGALLMRKETDEIQKKSRHQRQ